MTTYSALLIPITEFSGQYRFLSNFWSAPVTLDNVVYPTVEHAYQAAKSLDLDYRERVRLASTPGKAKRLGRTAALRSNWNVIRVDIMKALVFDKFHQNTELRSLLLNTDQRELIEGNYWGDTFWGVCRGQGLNVLGKILMEVRTKLCPTTNNETLS